ncbi:MAG: sterol desaturase family protein [Pseudohongiellaceae bacterium]
MNNVAEFKSYRPWLVVLLSLFVFRVVAQLLQLTFPVGFLPPFEDWQSGALPYPILLLSQIAISFYGLAMIVRMRQNRIKRSSHAGLVYLTIGGCYFLIMAVRLIAGFSFASEHPWFGQHLPAIFHLVLALFLIVIGLYHIRKAAQILGWLIYPMVMVSALTTHILMTFNGVGLFLSTYLPVTISALSILILEFKLPYRLEWLPTKNDITNDAVYLLIIQVLLPRFLSFLVVILILRIAEGVDFHFMSIWPDSWPVILQTMLMLVAAELMRYWLHRFTHQWIPLWRFHAVHHSPHKLYWLNVARFHPVEKSIQFAFDTLPFILLGAGDEVLAMYFVFYSINGFFQHCNINVEMGWLNYLISGPQLHRWHHSKKIKESNNNYGNNLIIWDLLFGTWFLPEDQNVGDLGLLNREYPMEFNRQLNTPFIKGLDKANDIVRT